MALSNVNHAAQKRAGRQYRGRTPDLSSVATYNPCQAPIRANLEILDSRCPDSQPRSFRQESLNRRAVEPSIRLRAGATNGRTLAAVQELEVYASSVSGAAHQAIQGVHFADQMPLADATDRGIA